MKYCFTTEFFESSALALRMSKMEGSDVRVLVKDHPYTKILEGILDKEPDLYPYMGEGNLFVFDDASKESAASADRLRKRGELVFGGSAESFKLEDERHHGQEIMKKAGIETVPSKNFKGANAAEEAKKFVLENKDKFWVFKQNHDFGKELNTVGKLTNSVDILEALDNVKSVWTEGQIDFDLMERVEGHEIALTGIFNGKDFLRDAKGDPVFVCNFEHKKRSDGETGLVTGETCTLAYRTRKDALINQELVKMIPYLKEIKYVGFYDLNMILDPKKKKLIGLEHTMRPGYPMVNLLMESIKTKWSTVLLNCAKGENNFLEIDPRPCVVVVLQVPPFPYESQKPSSQAKNQRIYFLQNGKMTDGDYKFEHLKHIHLYEVKYDKERKSYLCTGDSGYLLTVTAQADTVEQANALVIKRIKDNIQTKNMDYRKDCGISPRVKSAIQFAKETKFL